MDHIDIPHDIDLWNVDAMRGFAKGQGIKGPWGECPEIMDRERLLKAIKAAGRKDEG